LDSAALSLSLFSASFLPWFLTTPSKTSWCRPGKCYLAKRSTKPRSKHRCQLAKTSSKDMGNQCSKWVDNNHKSRLRLPNNPNRHSNHKSRLRWLNSLNRRKSRLQSLSSLLRILGTTS